METSERSKYLYLMGLIKNDINGMHGQACIAANSLFYSPHLRKTIIKKWRPRGLQRSSAGSLRDASLNRPKGFGNETE